MKRYVVFSALVGEYDTILQPGVIDKRFDFVLFTNETLDAQVGVWQIRPIDYQNRDNTRICRYIKTHPEQLLAEYEVSIWIDSNIQIIDGFFYDRIVEMDKQGVFVSSMWHPTRNCIYDEAFAVVNMMVEHESVVIDWCHFLKKENYPRYNGLCETNVVFRAHHSDLVFRFDQLWWNCIDQHSRRDQLSFNYTLWKLKTPFSLFFGEGKNARNTGHMCVVTHKDILHNHCPIGKDEAWLMRHCWKNPDETSRVSSLYYKLYSWPLPHIWIYLIGQYYRVIDRVK